MKTNKDSTRSLIAFLVTWSFLIMAVTGIVLYIVPQGRIAYWIHWSLLGLEKAQWGNVHMMFGGVFILSGILHLYYNWKPFKKYLMDRVKGHFHIRPELIASLFISFAILLMSIYNIPPVSWVFEMNKAIKDAWITRPELEPPFGHAEEVSLKAITRRVGLDYVRSVESLEKAGLVFKGDDPLITIAKKNDMTSMEVYGLISHAKQKGPTLDFTKPTKEELEAHFVGSGLGRKKLPEISDQIGLDTDTAKRRLANSGIVTEDDETLKTLAERHGKKPIDLIYLMLMDKGLSRD